MAHMVLHDLIFNTSAAPTLLCDVLLAALYQAPAVAFTAPTLARGAGVYCLYYVGDTHPLYNGLSKDIPIYIGKALNADGSMDYRLREHARSIQAAQDLLLAEFEYRFLPISAVWVAGCEAALIAYFAPLWNTVVRGFGNHPPGKGRQQQEMSPWDMLHNGRLWAGTLPITMPVTCIMDQVQTWCQERGFPARPPPALNSAQVIEEHFFLN